MRTHRVRFAFSYLFSGSKVYELSDRRVHKAYDLRDLFPGGPSHVDAAVFNPISGMMLLFGGRQVIREFNQSITSPLTKAVYGYTFSRLRTNFQLDSSFPKRLPSEISFTPSGALRWINGHQILLSSRDEFAVYDEYWNQSTLNNRISSYFPNMPSDVKGIESRELFLNVQI
ncbi:hypothetical protein TELCIR_12650 [Teladorsagia circumcincta]|uniref:Uncharacterized protein n=1 Tax=Teladorsagia circumcincta TaxID=45464 RepID=A0A2G9U671_TELCI|nr:hypothetical protein TELCIR_12650 [Teladorsagia circumcincta]